MIVKNIQYYIVLFLACILIVPFQSCKKDNKISRKIYKDTLISIDEVTQRYSNGYVEFMYHSSYLIKWKPPEEVKNDFIKNLNDFKILCKVIPDTELALREDYYQYVYNTKLKTKYLIKNKYTLNENEYDEFLELVKDKTIPDDECYTQKNKYKILDIEYFDLNSDGIDEYIIGDNCSLLNHCIYYCIIEKKNNKTNIIFEDCCELLVIVNKVFNGYFIVGNECPASRIVPIGSVTLLYKYDGKEYQSTKEEINSSENYDNEFYGDE